MPCAYTYMTETIILRSDEVFELSRVIDIARFRRNMQANEREHCVMA